MIITRFNHQTRNDACKTTKTDPSSVVFVLYTFEFNDFRIVADFSNNDMMYFINRLQGNRHLFFTAVITASHLWILNTRKQRENVEIAARKKFPNILEDLSIPYLKIHFNYSSGKSFNYYKLRFNCYSLRLVYAVQKILKVRHIN